MGSIGFVNIHSRNAVSETPECVACSESEGAPSLKIINAKSSVDQSKLLFMIFIQDGFFLKFCDFIS